MKSLDVAAVLAMLTYGGTAQAQETLTFPSPDTAWLARAARPPAGERRSGALMAVVRAGQVVWSGAFGTVNDSAKRPLDAGTVLRFLSKPVFAYLVLRLADRRELDLDRPLLDMLEYPRLAQDPRARSITARTVLSHATGLPNWAATRFVSGSPRARTTGIPAKVSSFSRRRSSGSPDEPSTRSRSVRCSGRSG